MTILNRRLAEDYSNFRTAMEDAPQGTFQKARDLFALVDSIMEDMLVAASVRGFKTDKCDRCFETEATIFDFLSYSNPDIANEVNLAITLGEQLRNGGLRERERILANLTSDRDFLHSMGQAA